MQEEIAGQAHQAAAVPVTRGARKQIEFAAFIDAYGKFRSDRTLSDAHVAATALANCIQPSGDAEADLKQATAMLDRLLKSEISVWYILFERAIDAEINATTFTDLKKLFSPEPSKLLVVKQIVSGGSVVLMGTDAQIFWDALLSGHCAHRSSVLGNKSCIHLLESNPKMWI
jgi:hypothetical protein